MKYLLGLVMTACIFFATGSVATQVMHLAGAKGGHVVTTASAADVLTGTGVKKVSNTKTTGVVKSLTSVANMVTTISIILSVIALIFGAIKLSFGGGNPQLSQDKLYKKMKAFKRTPHIPKENVVINNINANDGQDSVTVKGLKKGTELNIYNTKGQLMKVVKPKSSTYTIKMDKDEDVSKYFETRFNEKATQIIFSRKEPNSVESYRIRYTIPKEKASVRTPYQEHSQIKDSGSVRASIFLTNDTKYGMKSTIEFYSMTGKYPAKYRIKKNGKTVHTIDVAKKDMKYDQYKNDYQVSIEVPAANIPIIQQALKPTSLTVAKSMTITAQMEGMKESYPVSFYLPKGSNSMDFVSYGEYFE